MKKSDGAIKQRLTRLGLKLIVVTDEKSGAASSSELILPEDAPSVEEALLKVAAAMKAIETPGLSKTEILRLRCLVQTSGI